MAFTSETSVAVILVNWNGYAFTLACLASLSKVEHPKIQVILVDNGSTEPEGRLLKERYPQLRLIENQQNLGFAGGNNVGIRYALEAGFDQVLLLNNDTEVDPSFLNELQLCLQVPGCGVVQPLIFFLQEPHKIWSAGGQWNSFLGRAITRGDRMNREHYLTEQSQLDWATGCCMLLSREALLGAGLLDEQYFAYFEDVEWSLRIRQAGFTVALAEKAQVYHEAGASSKNKTEEGTLSPRVFFFHVRNQLFLLRQHRIVAGFAYHLIRFVFWAGYFLLRGRKKKMKAVLQGLRAGLFHPLHPVIR